MSRVPYQQHFGLDANPFSMAPDPDYLYLSAQHKEALAHLLYGIGTDGGFVLLTGAAGTGKTTVCRCLLRELPDKVDVACIEDPQSSAEALLAGVCRGFGLVDVAEAGRSVKRYVDRLNDFLLDNHAQGRRLVLIVDEAHRLDVAVLEQLRLLTNLETNERKLLQIMLIGRPELCKTLERPDLRQLSQRIVARFHIRPLQWREAGAYVQHRLAIAGGHAQILPDGLARWVHALSQGVPRTINLLCDRALLGAWTRREDQLDAEGLTRAAQEIGLTSAAPQPWEPSFAVAAIIIVTIFAAAVTVAGYETYGTKSTAAKVAKAMPLADVERLPASSTVARRAPRAVEPDEAGPPTPRAEPVVLPPASAGFIWPDAATRSRSSALAFAALLQQWGVTKEPRGPACESRLTDDLRCLRGRAGLDELRALNLPAVLHLKDDTGNRADALLLAIQDDSVLLKIADTEQRLAVDDLATRWQGDYSLLWRAPPAFDEPLRVGSRGRAVAWLRTRLARLRGEGEPASPAQAFDSRLLAQVREFQVLERLEPDGAAGIRTLARLAARTDPSVPTLGREVGRL